MSESDNRADPKDPGEGKGVIKKAKKFLVEFAIVPVGSEAPSYEVCNPDLTDREDIDPEDNFGADIGPGVANPCHQEHVSDDRNGKCADTVD